jgi:hypothetical protein
MRARSHIYPEYNENYTDTTHFDDNEKCLDIGYQRLKIFNPTLYPKLDKVKRLFIDHNNLTHLPDPSALPMLTELTCSYNKLTTIPLYPKLKFLNVANNKITDLNHYHNSKLIYFDCSYNQGFKMNFSLPDCKQLYVNDTDLESINLDKFPKIELLDCGNNKLTQIGYADDLIEINIQNNLIEELPLWPYLVRLVADNNKIGVLPSYPLLVSANVANNRLTRIKKQPLLRKLIANNNSIQELGKMPNLELIDISHNKLDSFTPSNKIEYVSLQFNPINNIHLNEDTLESIVELQVNFDTYKNIYKKYYEHFDAVNVHTNEEKLEKIMTKLDGIFNDKIKTYIFTKFKQLKFQNREETLFKTTLAIYWEYFPKDNTESLDELIKKKEFVDLLDKITNFYYKTIVITLYFNGYIDKKTEIN